MPTTKANTSSLSLFNAPRDKIKMCNDLTAMDFFYSSQRVRPFFAAFNGSINFAQNSPKRIIGSWPATPTYIFRVGRAYVLLAFE